MSGATVADRRLHPATLFIRFVKRAPEFVLGLPAFVGFASNGGMRRILLIALIGAAISFAGSLLAWLRFRYGVGERDIVIESGVLHRQRRIIPFDRVQDVDIEQKLLARLFGTAKVRIETGGGGKDEGSLDAIGLAEAYRIRDLIRGAAPAGAEVADQPAGEAAEPLLFELSFRRLLIAGLFNFSLFYLAVIGGALQYFQPLIERQVGDPRRWLEPTRERAEEMGLYISLALLGIVVLLGFITGVLRTITRDYRFRLSRAPSGFRRRRGLFTLSEVLIPLRRVQIAIVGSGWLRKRLGWFDLSFQTLSAEAQQSGHQAAAPFARLEEIEPILHEAGIPALPPADAFVRVSRLGLLRTCLRALFPLAIAIIAASLLWPLAALLLLPLTAGVGLVVLQWRRHRYVLGERAVYVSEGILRQKLWIMPFDKAQTISVTRTPLQRRFGLATVAIDTAGASIFQALAIRDVDAAIADSLARNILERFHSMRAQIRLAA